MKVWFIVPLLFIAMSAQSQFNKDKSLNLADTTLWHEGSIIKVDGQQLSGILRFNSQIGTLSFSDGQEEFTFSPNRLAGFEFFDKDFGKKRYFYVLENFNEKLKANKKDFYELLFDFKTFTMWSMVDQFETKIWEDQGTPGYDNSQFPVKRQVTKQIETIYVMEEDGPLVEFLTVESRERGKGLPDEPDDSSKGDINYNLIEKYIGEENYRKLRAYAKENKLNWRKKRDVLKIMEYYESLKRHD